ncbi:hypothetical protein KKA47_02390 [bacterium]|nr:hypothetical protein [bacterium]
MRRIFPILVTLAILSLFCSKAFALDLVNIEQIDWSVCDGNLISSVDKKGKLKDVIAKPLSSTYGTAIEIEGLVNHYVLCFDPQKNIETDETITIKNLIPNSVLIFHNLKLFIAEGKLLDSIIRIEDSQVVIYDADIDGAINNVASNILILNSTVNGVSEAESKGIKISGTDNIIKSTTISNFDYGVYLDSTAQNVKLTQNEFQGTFTEPIHLEPGANGDIQPIDTVSEDAKVWRHMDATGTTVEQILGIIEQQGTVELYKKSPETLSHVIDCPIKVVEETDYSGSEKIPAGSLVFICENFAVQLNDHVQLIFTASTNNTSSFSAPMKLEDFLEFTAPTISLDEQTTVVEEEKKEEITDDQYASYFEQTDLDDDDDSDDKNAADGASSGTNPVNTGFTCTLDPYTTSSGPQILITILMFLIPIVTIRKFSHGDI